MKRSTFNFVSISMAFQYSARYFHQKLPPHLHRLYIYSSPWSFSHHMNAIKNCIHACFCELIFTHITGLMFIYTCRIHNDICLVNFFSLIFFSISVTHTSSEPALWVLMFWQLCLIIWHVGMSYWTFLLHITVSRTMFNKRQIDSVGAVQCHRTTTIT